MLAPSEPNADRHRALKPNQALNFWHSGHPKSSPTNRPHSQYRPPRAQRGLHLNAEVQGDVAMQMLDLSGSLHLPQVLNSAEVPCRLGEVQAPE